MSWWNVLGVAVGLAMDSFAVSVAVGLSLPRVTPRHVFRLSYHFGLFQFLMPIIGWLIGKRFAHHVAGYDHWIAFLLLAYIGGRMLRESRRSETRDRNVDPTRGKTLVTLSVATSIDAFAVGVSLAFLGISAWGPCIVIGVVTTTLSAIGIGFGSRLGARWGTWAEAAGGCALLFIGLKILLTHLLA